MSRQRRNEPAVNDDEVLDRWRLLRRFSIPAVDPPPPATDPLMVFADRFEKASAAAGWPPTATARAAVVAAAPGWLAELGLEADFADFEQRYGTRRST